MPLFAPLTFSGVYVDAQAEVVGIQFVANLPGQAAAYGLAPERS